MMIIMIFYINPSLSKAKLKDTFLFSDTLSIILVQKFLSLH